MHFKIRYTYFKLCSWFADVLPCLARLLLRLPTLLEDHYAGVRAALGLRLLGSQGAGIVLFGQEADPPCSSACSPPRRGEARFPAINFDTLFVALTNNVRCRFLCRLTVMLG
ncbi:hypothetical protein VPH35_068332 [Triticum aestivum]|uniref:PARG helical domain-containing protein n=1 Tax=Triticum urartu TaxID=4572 RepID=A0A8R7QA97_TRIUA